MSDVEKLLQHIDFLNGLLACYRIQRRPTEKLMKLGDKTRVWEQQIRAAHEV